MKSKIEDWNKNRTGGYASAEFEAIGYNTCGSLRMLGVACICSTCLSDPPPDLIYKENENGDLVYKGIKDKC